VDRITDAFVWPVRDPEWVRKMLVMGLLLLIPLLGAINAVGWMVAAIGRLRAGDERLPPAGFGYISRGWPLFIVSLAYGLSLVAVYAVVSGAAYLMLRVQDGQESPQPLVAAVAIVLLFVASGAMTLGSLLLTAATPAIVLAVLRGGISAGLNVRGVALTAVRSPFNTLTAGLMLIAASFIESLGLFVCVVGILFTSVYGLAMEAWIVRSFELGAAAPGRPATT
jgi:hypothetical protein